MLGLFPKVNWKEEGEVPSRVEWREILCPCVFTKCLVNCLCDFHSRLLLMFVMLHLLAIVRIANHIYYSLLMNVGCSIGLT